MTIPSWWQAAILVIATYRLTRLIGWDEWPPIEKLRARILGERYVPTTAGRLLDSADYQNAERLAKGEDPDLPGKTPEAMLDFVRPAYDRPTLAHLVHCPFCLGWWVALSCWVGFEVSNFWALVALTPFALAGAASLIGKNLD